MTTRTLPSSDVASDEEVDAVYSASRSLVGIAARSIAGVRGVTMPQYRMLVVLSDGNDSDSLHTIADVVVAALRNDFQIYALTIGKGQVEDRGANILKRLADATGGRMYVARSSGDLDAAFAQIERDLRTQYFVSFPPPQRTSGYHSLRVEIRAHQKVQVHERHASGERGDGVRQLLLYACRPFVLLLAFHKRVDITLENRV